MLILKWFKLKMENNKEQKHEKEQIEKVPPPGVSVKPIHSFK